MLSLVQLAATLGTAHAGRLHARRVPDAPHHRRLRGNIPRDRYLSDEPASPARTPALFPQGNRGLLPSHRGGPPRAGRQRWPASMAARPAAWPARRGPKPARLLPMRVAAAIVVLAFAGWAQFKSTVPLVVAPTTVTDSKGRYVDGLTPDDLILYDNNVPQAIQMDWMTYPIDLVVAVQTSANSGAVIDKLGGSGILFTQLLAADAGETAVISFSDEVKVHQDFTGDPDPVIHALRMLRKEGGDAHMLDALRQALLMLERRPPRTAADHPHDCGEARSFEQGEAGRSDGASRAAQCRGLLADLFAVLGAVHRQAQDCRGSETRRRADQGQAVRSLPGARRHPRSARFGTGRPALRARRIDAAAPAGSFQPVHRRPPAGEP